MHKGVVVCDHREFCPFQVAAPDCKRVYYCQQFLLSRCIVDFSWDEPSALVSERSPFLLKYGADALYGGVCDHHKWQ